MKRIFDFSISLILLLITFPLIAVLCLVVSLDSKGGALFRQVRIGKDRKEFTLLKIRTMALGTRNAGSHEISSSCVTRVGGALRRFKLDELPQLWNVVVGDMSLVGPRPCLPSQTELVLERESRSVFCVLPGVTGLAQVEGLDMSDPVELADKDFEYISRASFVFDLKILWRTFVGKGIGDAVS